MNEFTRKHFKKGSSIFKIIALISLIIISIKKEVEIKESPFTICANGSRYCTELMGGKTYQCTAICERISAEGCVAEPSGRNCEKEYAIRRDGRTTEK